MKIYTRIGDNGLTKLANGVKVRKNDCIVEAYGTVDELSSFLGLAVTHLPKDDLVEVLVWVQRRLFALASILAGGPGNLSPEDVARLEAAIDTLDAELPLLKDFIIPGGSHGAALLHVARSVCRRAERLIVAIDEPIEPEHEHILPFLNRLSDYLFCAARYVNYQEGLQEHLAGQAGAGQAT
ncbi:MAG TPA: cob(I)yrinic acid a,c-diamide adenosyltransferase [Limnochordia bacterium]|nr:cob(I)yrinic acid a,c-diamide adenosyltransferase [Limnochordia bacterium]